MGDFGDDSCERLLRVDLLVQGLKRFLVSMVFCRVVVLYNFLTNLRPPVDILQIS